MAAAVVVATTLVRDARSKRAEGFTSRLMSKSPPCREERDKDGAPSTSASYVKCPKDFRATKRSWWVTAIDALGKARAEIA